MAIQLRPYQEDLIKGLRKSLKQYDNVIAVLPTGGGKTFTFSFIVKNAWERGKKILILTDRTELLTQAGGALKAVGLQPLQIKAGTKPNLNGSLYVGMSETIKRRTDKDEYKDWLNKMDLIIVDECHKRSFTKLFEFKREDAKILGFTATPERMGKKDQLGETYEDIVAGVEIEYLVNNGFLARPNYYGVKADLSGVKMKSGDYDQNDVANRFSQSKLYAGVFKNWSEKVPDTKTLIFSSNISSSLEIVEEFKSHGYDCRHLDSTMSKKDREAVLRWFHNEPKGILSNVGILTTGFDEPSIQTVILYRATVSLSLYLQMVGRGSRTTETKKEFNLLDFGNNIATHGFWHDKRQWSLDIKSTNKRKKGEAVLKNCPNCEAFIPASAVVCSECGFEDVKEKKKQEIAELQLLTPGDLNRKAKRGDLEEKIKLAKNKLVNPMFCLHQLTDVEEVKKFISEMGYSNAWIQVNKHRFEWGKDFS